MNDLPATHLAETYLGNQLQDPALAAQLTQAAYLEVMLDPADRVKGRIYAQTTTGEPVGITKDRHWSLAEGDVFQTRAGQLVLVHLQSQTVMVLRITQPAPDDALRLIHLGHTLGNHHWPILIDQDKIYVQLSGDRTVVESTLQGFQIPGLDISYEVRSPMQHLSFSSHQHP